MAIIAGVLAVISLDAVARPLLERMIAEGRLPHHAELLGRGHTYALTTTPIHASIYRSLYTGCRMSTHGVHYPLQWCAAEQCVKPADGMNPDDSIFTRLERAGRRLLVVDPPECGVFAPGSSIASADRCAATKCSAGPVLPICAPCMMCCNARRSVWSMPRSSV